LWGKKACKKPSEAGLFQVVCEKDMFLSSGVFYQPPRFSWFINPSPGRGRWIPPPAAGGDGRGWVWETEEYLVNENR